MNKDEYEEISMELENFFDSLPERIQDELELMYKNGVEVLEKTGELRQILQTDKDVLACKDKNFRVQMAISKLLIKQMKLWGTVNKWITIEQKEEEEVNWDL